jgi:hypothetical protein
MSGKERMEKSFEVLAAGCPDVGEVLREKGLS